MSEYRRSIVRWYLHIDPGCLRIYHGTRSVFAALLALLITLSAPLEVGVFAALSATCFMQARAGHSTREKHLLFLGASIITLGLVFLGNAFQLNQLVTHSLLIIASFLGFYLRRFGAQFSLLPILVLVVVLMSTVFPGGPDRVAENMFGVLMGLLSAYVTLFLLFPVRERALFSKRQAILFQDAIFFMQQLINSLDDRNTQRVDNAISWFTEQCRQAYQYNMKLIKDYFQPRQKSSVIKRLEKQYVTTKSVIMLGESLTHCLHLSQPLSATWRSSFQEIIHILEHFDIKKRCFSLPTMEPFKVLLDKISVENKAVDPDALIDCYEVDLNLSRLYTHLSSWVQPEGSAS